MQITRSTSYQLAILLCTIFVGACSHSTHAIRRMETFDMPLNTTSLVALRPEDLIGERGKTNRVQSNKAYLETIDERLDLFQDCDTPQYPDLGVDARIVCLIYRDSDKPDTLAIDAGYMSYRGFLCNTDTVLLRRIVDSLSETSKVNYEWFLKTFQPFRSIQNQQVVTRHRYLVTVSGTAMYLTAQIMGGNSRFIYDKIDRDSVESGWTLEPMRIYMNGEQGKRKSITVEIESSDPTVPIRIQTDFPINETMTFEGPMGIKVFSHNRTDALPLR